MSDLKQTKYLIFREVPAKLNRKTKVVKVLNRKSDSVLGYILWWGPWRQYVFAPKEQIKTIFNPDCLKDICGVIDDLMEDRKG